MINFRKEFLVIAKLTLTSPEIYKTKNKNKTRQKHNEAGGLYLAMQKSVAKCPYTKQVPTFNEMPDTESTISFSPYICMLETKPHLK